MTAIKYPNPRWCWWYFMKRVSHKVSTFTAETGITSCAKGQTTNMTWTNCLTLHRVTIMKRVLSLKFLLWPFVSRQINQALEVYQSEQVGCSDQQWQSREILGHNAPFSNSITSYCDGSNILAKLMVVSKYNIILLRRRDCSRSLDRTACLLVRRWSHKFQRPVVRGNRVMMESHFHSFLSLSLLCFPVHQVPSWLLVPQL